jgi:hypothetical protein
MTTESTLRAVCPPPPFVFSGSSHKKEQDEDLTLAVERTYDSVGVGACAQCQQYKKLFIFRFHSTKLFDATLTSQEMHDCITQIKKRICPKLKRGFITHGYALDGAIIVTEGAQWTTWILTNTVLNKEHAPWTIKTRESFTINKGEKVLTVMLRHETLLCVNCLADRINSEFLAAVDFEVVV